MVEKPGVWTSVLELWPLLASSWPWAMSSEVQKAVSGGELLSCPSVVSQRWKTKRKREVNEKRLGEFGDGVELLQ